jgi:hypothetical protein
MKMGPNFKTDQFALAGTILYGVPTSALVVGKSIHPTVPMGMYFI